MRSYDKEDETRLISPLLDLLAEHKLDFHGTFRLLTSFQPSLVNLPSDGGDSAELDAYVARILALSGEPQFLNREKAAGDVRDWLQRYGARIEKEHSEWAGGEATEGRVDAERRQVARAANPRFVLRQWVLEEVIKKVEEDAESGKRVLRKVLKVRSLPFRVLDHPR